MKRLGLIGLPGVELTTYYARLITEEIRHRCGDGQCANLLTITTSSAAEEITDLLAAVHSLGAEAAVICSGAVQAKASEAQLLPVLSIYAPVAQALRSAGVKRVGLVGTHEPIAETRWRTELNRAGVHDVLLPVVADRAHLFRLCQSEFSRGLVSPSARADVVRIVHSLRQAGARAVVAVTPEVTEILLEEVPVVPVYDVAELHAVAAADWMTGTSIGEPLLPVARDSTSKKTSRESTTR